MAWHFVNNLRGLERLRKLMSELALCVDGVDPWDRDPDCAVREDIIDAITVPSVQGLAVREKLLDVAQTCDLELFRLALDDLAVERIDKRCRIQEQRSVRQIHVTLKCGS